jgi:hypothetical protein
MNLQLIHNTAKWQCMGIRKHRYQAECAYHHVPRRRTPSPPLRRSAVQGLAGVSNRSVGLVCRRKMHGCGRERGSKRPFVSLSPSFCQPQSLLPDVARCGTYAVNRSIHRWGREAAETFEIVRRGREKASGWKDQSKPNTKIVLGVDVYEDECGRLTIFFCINCDLMSDWYYDFCINPVLMAT